MRSATSPYFVRRPFKKQTSRCSCRVTSQPSDGVFFERCLVLPAKAEAGVLRLERSAVIVEVTVVVLDLVVVVIVVVA